MAVEAIAPLAEQLRASFEADIRAPGQQGSEHRLDVANVFLDVYDDPTLKEVILRFPPVVAGRSIQSSALISCCKENVHHPQFVRLHAEGVRTYCSQICSWEGRDDPTRWAVPRAKWDTLWREKLQSRRVDFIKVDFDPGHGHWWQHMRQGWSEFLNRRAFGVMVLELDERAYWNNLDKLVSFFSARDYAVFLKWPCSRKMNDGGFQKTAYAPLTGLLMDPAVPEGIARGNDPHDLLILDRHLPELFRLIALGNAECGTGFPEPWHPCR